MVRVFFTGAFRKPRETSWAIGVMLLMLGILEGFIGYSLPDDLLSGTGLRIGSGIVMSIPVIGTWAHWLLWGGEFPGPGVILPRLYIVHVLLVPGILFALIAVHLGLVWYQKHTQFPGPRKTERNVVGVRIVPTFAVKSIGFATAVVGVLAVMSGLFQINPIWNYGPYDPAQVSAASQPDWYMGFTEGLLRLFPPWEIYLGNYTISPVFWAVVVIPGIMTMLLLGYPALERTLTHDYAEHNLLQRPRDVPTRTALGAMAITFFLVLLISGANDVIAFTAQLSINAFIWAGRIALLVLPPLAYYLTYQICLALQRADREVLAHGIETGIIRRLPHGEFIEVHQPLAAADEHLRYGGAPVPRRMNQLGAAGAPVPGSLYRPDPPEQTAALQATRDGHR
jgi:ubiquinol-cytochrome c reductase cytochrome b subunit